MASKENKTSDFVLNLFLLKNRSTILFTLLSLLIGFLVRVYNLLSIPIFADEAIYVRWSQVMKAVATLRFLPLTDGKQPLFMWAVIPFFKLFSDPLIAGRMVSVMCGMVSMVGIFILAYILFKNWKISVIAIFLYAVSPFTMFFDRMALADSMLSMFGIWSMIFAVLTAKTKRLDVAMLAGFALGGAMLTKSPAIFFAALFPFTYLLSGLSVFNRKDYFSLLKLLGLWCVSWVIGYGMYNVLRLGPGFDMINSRNQDYIFTLSEVLRHPFDPLRPHINLALEWYGVLLPGTVLIAALISPLVKFKKYLNIYLVLFAWIIIPLIIESEFFKVFTARYILFTVPPLFILAALSLSVLVNIKRIYFISLLFFIVLPGLWIDYKVLTDPNNANLPKEERQGYLEMWTSGYGIHEVAQYIKQEHYKNPNQQIVVGTEGFFGTLPDGLMIYDADVPGVVIRGVGLSINTVHDSLLNAKRAGDRVFLVANTSRLEDGAYGQGMNIIATYPKAIQPSGKQESLILFEVTDESIRISEERERHAKEEAEKQKAQQQSK